MKNLLGFAGIILIGYMVYTYHSPVTTNIIPNIEKGITNTGHIIDSISSNLTTQIPEIMPAGGKAINFSKCSQPITYSVGNFSNDFGVSEEYFLNSIQKAEKIWEDAIDKNLFEYKNDTTPDLKINLVYDYRQETMTELKNLGIEISKTRESYNAVRSEYNNAKTAYIKYKASYEAEVLAFNTRAKIVESKVSYWNSMGGAPEEEYNSLLAEKTYLENELNNIKQMEQNLNKRLEQANGLANTLNKIAEALNLNVNKYNVTGSELGESYEEGLYVQNGKERYIDIYEFQSEDQLVRILAHELGHALGIGHLENDESIMHAISLSKNLVPTKEDLAALSSICGLNIAN